MAELKDFIGAHIMQGVEEGFGSDENYIKFTLDGRTYKAIEDPSDGYRSYLRDIIPVGGGCKYKLPDVPTLLSVEDNEDREVLVFKDARNGLTFLKIGTDYYDSYYPYCIFDYTPENLEENRNPHRIPVRRFVTFLCSRCGKRLLSETEECPRCHQMLDWSSVQ